MIYSMIIVIDALILHVTQGERLALIFHEVEKTKIKFLDISTNLAQNHCLGVFKEFTMWLEA